jgi:hypothetical protein
MLTVYSTKHQLRNARTELYGGEVVSPHECAERAEYLMERVKATRIGEIVSPADARDSTGPGNIGSRGGNWV